MLVGHVYVVLSQCQRRFDYLSGMLSYLSNVPFNGMNCVEMKLSD